ncbi:hypothetical protein OFC58_37725, partial [Escherichia coli]|nr:hypothetical protein [Escherichia coli]
MQNNFKSLLWNAVFVLVLLSICGLVYLSGKRIDYSWNWERVLPYIATNAASSITAPVDGNIILDE